MCCHRTDMNGIENVAINALALAIDGIVHSAASTAAGALGMALISVPWHCSMSQPSQDARRRGTRRTVRVIDMQPQFEL